MTFDIVALCGEQPGVDHAQLAPGSVRLVGSGTRQAAWCRLDADPARRLLTTVLEHFGVVQASP